MVYNTLADCVIREKPRTTSQNLDHAMVAWHMCTHALQFQIFLQGYQASALDSSLCTRHATYLPRIALTNNWLISEWTQSLAEC